MDTVGPPTTTLLAAYIVPSAGWLVWMAEFYGPPLKAHSVSFCLHKMALADVCVAGLCSHRQAWQPLRLFAFTSHVEVQQMAVLGAALLREASVSPFVSFIS